MSKESREKLRKIKQGVDEMGRENVQYTRRGKKTSTEHERGKNVKPNESSVESGGKSNILGFFLSRCAIRR